MQNYRGNTNESMRRGTYGRSGRNHCGCVPEAAPYPVYEKSSCCERDDALEGMPLAMAYVPWQNWKRIYEIEKGFARGTIFEELDKPFHGRGGCNQ